MINSLMATMVIMLLVFLFEGKIFIEDIIGEKVLYMVNFDTENDRLLEP